MTDPDILCQAILESLAQVIDPETGVDVVRMRLIEDLTVSQDGHVTYKFRPSSPFCPLAVPLSVEIQKAVSTVDGVTGQDLQVVGFTLSDELTAWLSQALKDNNEKKDK
jgi:metal-sulfur cluster biosynthetic enzyme